MTEQVAGISFGCIPIKGWQEQCRQQAKYRLYTTLNSEPNLVKLIFSTEAYTVDGVSYRDFPLILDNAMNIQWHILNFLIDACLGLVAANNPGTWAQYGGALYDYFGFCEANNYDWSDTRTTAKLTTIEKYHNWSMAECGLEESTINDRLRVIHRFYEFCLAQGWIKNLPWIGKKRYLKDTRPSLIKKNISGGDHTYPSSRKKSITTIKILSRSQVDTLLNSITNLELKLITRLGLACGLRKQELLTFPIKYVVNPKKFSSTKLNYRVRLNPKEMRLKLNKGRQIDIPASLMQALWDYTQFSRSARASLCSDERDTTILFLNSQGRRFSHKGRGLNKLYNDLNLPFKVYPHLLRHTYATHTLYVLRKMNIGIEPLIYVRDRLGHTSVTTTEIYLHFIELVEDELLDIMQNKLDDYYREVAKERKVERDAA